MRSFVIRTTYLRPTANRGARVRAEVLGAPGFSSASVAYDHAFDLEGNSRLAISAFLRKNGLAWTVGEHPAGVSGRGLAWVASETTA